MLELLPTVPIFDSNFSEQDACPMQVLVQSMAQIKADFDAATVSSNLFVDVTNMPSELKLHYKARSNTEVKVYEHAGDTVTCDLGVIG